MNTQLDKLSLLRTLTDAGIRPSAQRLEILEFISGCRTHPSANEVYLHLAADNPTLSRTTVFNSLRILAEHGVINDINIDSDSTRYDAPAQTPHAHFICRKCRRIFDIVINLGDIKIDSDYTVDNVNVFFKGLCPECAVTENSTN